MAPATRTRRRPSNTTEAPPSPYKASTGAPRISRPTRKGAGGSEIAGAEIAGGGDLRREKMAFVTVGTTRFDALVRSVDSPEFEIALLSRGFSKLVVQAGAGGHAPERLLELNKMSNSERATSSSASAATATTTTTKTSRFSGTTANGLSVEFFDYAPSLRDRFAAADLVVTHAGAGSIFETLSMSRSRPAASASASAAAAASCARSVKGKSPSSSAPIPLIAVPNGALMHNHQAELASELEARGLLVSATPETLAEVLSRADFSRLREYEAGGVQGVVAAIDELSQRRKNIMRKTAAVGCGKERGR